MNPGLLVMVFGSFAAVLWLVSAVFWARSAGIEIRDNQDAFIATYSASDTGTPGRLAPHSQQHCVVALLPSAKSCGSEQGGGKSGRGMMGSGWTFYYILGAVFLVLVAWWAVAANH